MKVTASRAADAIRAEGSRVVESGDIWYSVLINIIHELWLLWSLFFFLQGCLILSETS